MLFQNYGNNITHAEEFCFNEVVHCFTVYKTRDYSFRNIAIDFHISFI